MLDQFEHGLRKRRRLRRNQLRDRRREYLRMRQQIGGDDGLTGTQVRIDLEWRVGTANARRHQQIRGLHKTRDLARRLLARENHRGRNAGSLRPRLCNVDLRRLATDHEHARVGTTTRDNRGSVDQHLDALVGFERAGVKRERRFVSNTPRRPHFLR